MGTDGKPYQWTPAMVNASGFGVFFDIGFYSGGSGAVASIDQVEVTVHYSFSTTSAQANLTQSTLPSAENCTAISLSNCQGANVTENFNSTDGGFSSNIFEWNERNGNWMAKGHRRIDEFSLTSGSYTLQQNGYVNYGFTLDGGGWRVDIAILEAKTGVELAYCPAIQYSKIGNWVCGKLPLLTGIENFTVGREVVFKFIFFGGYGGKPITFDNFSVGGSAVAVSGSASNKAEKIPSEKKKMQPTVLQVKVFSNPTTTSFNMLATSASSEQLTMKVSDALGRVVEVRKNLNANSMLQFGSKYKPGAYYVEMVQGSTTKRFTLIKR
jgi:hypothetical protein